METEVIKNRYDFVFLFDVKDGNPNGDPDFDNMPRTDEETDQGLVSDVCIKRKVRNYVHLLKGLQKPYDIFIREGNVLNPLIQEKRNEADEANDDEKKAVKSGREVMCAQYYDIRTFGAVMSTSDEKTEEPDTEGKRQKVRRPSQIRRLKDLVLCAVLFNSPLLALLILYPLSLTLLLVAVLQRNAMLRTRTILLVINIL